MIKCFHNLHRFSLLDYHLLDSMNALNASADIRYFGCLFTNKEKNSKAYSRVALTFTLRNPILRPCSYSSRSTVESLSYWVCIYGRLIHVSKLGSSNSTVGRGHLQGTLFWYSFIVLFFGTHL